MSRWQNFKRRQQENYAPSNLYVEVDHITAHRPQCSECSALACVWQRCKCRRYFGRCENHQPSEVAEMRRRHQEKCNAQEAT